MNGCASLGRKTVSRIEKKCVATCNYLCILCAYSREDKQILNANKLHRLVK